jgi:S1-C subfamily serine protease
MDEEAHRRIAEQAARREGDGPPPPIWPPPYVSQSPPPLPPAEVWPGAPSPEPPRAKSSGVRAALALAAVMAVVGLLLAYIGFGFSDHNGSSVTPSPVAPTQAPATTGGAADQSAATSKLDVGVVDIDTRLGFESARAAGTGMIITSSGEVLTNTHVISGATSITVTIVTTGRSYSAEVLGSDTTHDVALLKIKGASGLDTVKLGDSSEVVEGDQVTAVGNAGGVGGIPSVSPGTVTALDQTITVSDENGSGAARLSDLIETDAALQPGDSGGPLYDDAGVVIGMNTAAEGGQRYRPVDDQSYAIAIDTAEQIVKQIESGQESNTVQIGVRGFLGVTVGGQVDTSTTPGAYVSGVLDGTPAADAGLQEGDVITAIDGKSVDSDNGLSVRLHGHHPGDKVTVTWTDSAGQTRNATVTLTTGPAA